MTVGLGVTTFNRPAFAERCLKAIAKHCSADTVDHIIVVNDGSDHLHRGSYGRVYKVAHSIGAVVRDEPVNRGVAATKNIALDYLMPRCDWVILVEDDILAKSPEAITEYVRLCKARDLGHLSFAHHGPANLQGPVGIDDEIAYYPHSIGAWCIYSTEALKEVGVFDELFHNAWEHVELELRLASAGYGGGAYNYPDVRDSASYLAEIPNSIEKSSIRPLPSWQSSISDGLRYWKQSKPDTFNMLFGPDKPLYAYAQSVLGGS